MIILGRSRWIRDLDILLGAQGEKSFKASARMFRSLAFKAVRQEQHETAQLLPFILGAGDKLIDDRLRDIPEVTELRFPQNQPFRTIQTVTIFESEHASLRERAVDDFDGRL